MKPSSQLNKCGTSNSKSKKNSKDREKKKPQGNAPEINNHTPAAEKGSPTKDSNNTRLYAGIDSDSVIVYAEQTGFEHLSEEVTNTLTEDINYKLRYIINDSLIKARLTGRNAITCQDIEHTFENLRIDKIYGPPSHPNWVPFGYQNLYYLDDKVVNLVEIAREENIHYQYHDAIITQKWLPEKKEVSKGLKNYFTVMCQSVVSNDIEVRRTALKNIRENPRICPIIEWFYNFGYILLSKDITYDCLTLRALDLIANLEHSQICRVNVSEKQLKLLVRLILQRLLKSTTTEEILKPICNILSILSGRAPLKEFVILKVKQKLNEVFHNNHDLAVITVINYLGVDAVKSIFLPNLQLFLKRTLEKKESTYTYAVLECYNILSKESLVDYSIYNTFFAYFGESLLMFANNQKWNNSPLGKKELNFVHVKRELIKTRRKLNPISQPNHIPINEVFELPLEHSKLRNNIDRVIWNDERNETAVIIGKNTLLLPVFQQNQHKKQSTCHSHILWYSL